MVSRMRAPSSVAHYVKHAAVCLVLCMVVLAGLVVRAERAGEQAMAESDLAFDQGQLSLSMSKAREAVRWYFPFAPHVARAEARLLAIAEGAEASGQLRLALAAWSGLHAALHETAHGFASKPPLLERCNHAIVRLLPRPGGLMSPTPDTGQLLAAYEKTERGEPVFYLARCFGMGLLLLGVWLLFLRQRQHGVALGLGCLGCGLFAWVFAALGA
jgi:hypothetical protein